MAAIRTAGRGSARRALQCHRHNPATSRYPAPEDPGGRRQAGRAEARLLRHAVTLVRPGGRIVWCTCSLQPEEGEEQVDRVLQSGAPVRRIPITADEVGGLAEVISASGDIRTLPCHGADWGGLDGFHIARLIRDG